MKNRHKGDTVPGILTVLVGIFFFIQTMITPNLSFGSTTSDGVPGAGFFPYLLSGALIIAGLALTVRGIKQKGKIQYLELSDEIKKNLKVLLLTFIGLVVFLAFWRLTNLFFAAVFLFCIYLNIIFERTKKFTAVYAVVFTAFIYIVFSVAFSIQF